LRTVTLKTRALLVVAIVLPFVEHDTVLAASAGAAPPASEANVVMAAPATAS
jgi:hypothetical protein